jgi:hypothetical protein
VLLGRVEVHVVADTDWKRRLARGKRDARAVAFQCCAPGVASELDQGIQLGRGERRAQLGVVSLGNQDLVTCADGDAAADDP